MNSIKQLLFASMNILGRREEKISLPEFINRNIACLESTGRSGTAKCYRSLAASLRGFLNGRTLKLGDITGSDITDYNRYLISRGITRNTVSFYMRTLRVILRKGRKFGYGSFSAEWFEDVYTGVDETRKRALSRTELLHISSLDLHRHPSLELSRDLFMFSFYLRGMAFVDVAYLTTKNIEGNTLYYKRRKTGQQLSVRLTQAATGIIEKYSNQNGVFLFPILKDNTRESYDIALRNHNNRLKKIGCMAGISVRLSSYMSRHSWASLAQKANVPIAVISAGMGHTSEKTTRIYLSGIGNEAVDRANRIVSSLIISSF